MDTPRRFMAVRRRTRCSLRRCRCATNSLRNLVSNSSALREASQPKVARTTFAVSTRPNARMKYDPDNPCTRKNVGTKLTMPTTTSMERFCGVSWIFTIASQSSYATKSKNATTAEAGNPNPSQVMEKPTEAPESRWTTLQRSSHFPSRQISVRTNLPSRVRCIIELHTHSLQCGDSLFNWRVRAENLGNKFPALRACPEPCRGAERI